MQQPKVYVGPNNKHHLYIPLWSVQYTIELEKNGGWSLCYFIATSLKYVEEQGFPLYNGILKAYKSSKYLD